jgi:hypothetical protein
MPTVMRIGPYRFFFYSNEGHEPMHIHVKSDENEAKFWLEPIQLVWNHGYNERRLSEIRAHVEENQATFVSAWREYFGA